MSVSAEKPWATPGGMTTPQSWCSPISTTTVWPSLGAPSSRSWGTTRARPWAHRFRGCCAKTAARDGVVAGEMDQARDREGGEEHEGGARAPRTADLGDEQGAEDELGPGDDRNQQSRSAESIRHFGPVGI